MEWCREGEEEEEEDEREEGEEYVDRIWRLVVGLVEKVDRRERRAGRVREVGILVNGTGMGIKMGTNGEEGRDYLWGWVGSAAVGS